VRRSRRAVRVAPVSAGPCRPDSAGKPDQAGTPPDHCRTTAGPDWPDHGATKL